MSDALETEVDSYAMEHLISGLERVREAPKDAGVLELIIARPAVDERVELAQAELGVDQGLLADRWRQGSRSNPKSQLTVANSRAVQLVAGDRSRWCLAGDQLYVDFDLSGENIPPGTRLSIGEAIIEVSDQPHLGCEKFSARYGRAARALANSPEGMALNVRGINTRVVKGGVVRIGDTVRKV